MSPVHQTIINTTNGNCMQAAVASILEIPLDMVPNFVLFKDWFQALNTFLTDNGYAYECCLDVRDHPDSINWVEHYEGVNGYFIVCGKSPRFDALHAVVYKYENGRFELSHDPHPSGLGVEDVQYIDCIRKLPVSPKTAVQPNP